MKKKIKTKKDAQPSKQISGVKLKAIKATKTRTFKHITISDMPIWRNRTEQE